MNWNGLELPDNPYFSDDAVIIYCADCRDILPLIPDKSVDLVLTDPPYGIGEAAGKNHSRGNHAPPKRYAIMDWDDRPISQELIDMVILSARHSIIFGGNYYAVPPSSCWLVWDKVNGASDFADCELAWTNFKTAVRKYEWKWQGMLQQAGTPKEVRSHPTQKPAGLFGLILSDYSKENEVILDPFSGSGTTPYCAKKLGRKCIAIEIEECYAEISAKRCSQSVMRLE